MSVIHIAARELRSLFCSPLAWVLIAVIQAILGWLFMIQVWGFEKLAPGLQGLSGAPGITVIVISPVLKTAATVLLMVTPLVTMRLLSEERRNGTLMLLMSSPVSMTEVALGKFLGGYGFYLIVLAIISLMPASLLAGADLDIGLVLAGFLGLALLCAAFTAIGLFVSSLTSNPTAAAGGTLGVLLGFWMMDWAGAGASTEGIGQLLHYLSLTRHLDGMLRGLLDTADVAYYLLVTAAFLVLTVRRLDRQRLVD